MASQGVSGRGRLRGDRDLARYVAARLVSYAGGSIAYVALPVLVYRLSHSPLLTGAVTAAEALPYLFLGLVAGVVADRMDRRALMIRMDLTGMVVMASIPLAAAAGVLTSAQALVVAALSATVFVFFDAANFAALPALVGRSRLPRANAMVWTAMNIMDVALPALTGLALVVVSPSSLIAVNAITFGASALLYTRIRRDFSGASAAVAGRSMRADITEGLRFIATRPGVRTLTIFGAAQAFASYAFMGQLVVLADREYHLRAGLRFGLLYASWSVGATVAALAYGRLDERFGSLRLALTLAPVSAALAIGIALARPYWDLIALLTAWGGIYMLIVMAAVTYRQVATPDHLLSRVNTTGRMLSWGLGSAPGAAVGGIVASAFGVRAALGVGAAVVSVVAAYAFALRRTPPERADDTRG